MKSDADHTAIVQAVHLALGSGQFEKTTEKEWIEHLAVLRNRGHMEMIVSPQGILCGFMTWVRTEEPVRLPVDKLPEDLGNGDYIQVILAVIHPHFAKNEHGLIRELRDMVLEKNKDAKYWSWVRNKDGEEKFVTHPIRRKKDGK